MTLTAISLGVAVFVAVRSANRTILHSYRNGIAALTGRTDLSIRGGPQGLDERVFETIRKIPGVRLAAPVVEIAALAEESGEAIPLLGVDLLIDSSLRDYEDRAVPDRDLSFLTDPNALFLSEAAAAQLKTKRGETLAILAGDRRAKLTVREIFRMNGPGASEPIALMDIAAAQWSFGRLGRIDRIDLLIEGEPAPLVARLLGFLPADARVAPPQERGEEIKRMLSAFQANLTALASISLLVGLFLVYNSLSTAVLRRRKEIGILRALGTPRRSILFMIGGECLILGSAGAFAGLPLGILLARSALRLIGGTVGEIYLPFSPAGIFPEKETLFEGFAAGVLVSLAGGLIPALRAGRVPPREAVDQGRFLPPLPAGRRLWEIFFALALSATAMFLAFAPTGVSANRFPLLGYLSAVSLLAGIALLSPALLFIVGALGRRLRPATARLAADSLVSGLRRHAVTAAALMVAVAMASSVIIMIESFRRTVEEWIDQTVTAGLLAAPPAALFKGVDARIAPEAVAAVMAAPQIAQADPYRSFEIPFGDGHLLVAGRDLKLHAERAGYLFLQGASKTILRRAAERDEAVISEPLARRTGLSVGDIISLPSPSGVVKLPIAGVFYDYSTEAGKVVMDRSLLIRRWGDSDVNLILLYPKEGSRLEEIREALAAQLGERHRLAFITRGAFREEILRIFDRTFLVTYALEAIAAAVALLAVLNTLSASVFERRREIGILRSMGASSGQIVRIVFWEAGYLSAGAALLGSLAGTLLSTILIFVINRQSFGWTIRFYFPPLLLPKVFLLVLPAALLAALLPAVQAARTKISDAISYE